MCVQCVYCNSETVEIFYGVYCHCLTCDARFQVLAHNLYRISGEELSRLLQMRMHEKKDEQRR
jgi:hypothetical protein